MVIKTIKEMLQDPIILELQKRYVQQEIFMRKVRDFINTHPRGLEFLESNIDEQNKMMNIANIKKWLVLEFGIEQVRETSWSFDANNPYDFRFIIKDKVPFYGYFRAWDEHKDEIMELLKEQVKEG